MKIARVVLALATLAMLPAVHAAAAEASKSVFKISVQDSSGDPLNGAQVTV